MWNSEGRILTSHVGSLPRPDELIAANRARAAGERPGEAGDEAGFQQMLRAPVSWSEGVAERRLKRRPGSAITLCSAGLAQR